MNLKPEDIEKFKSIYKDKFGKDLSNNEALEYANALMSLTKILLSNSQKIGK